MTNGDVPASDGKGEDEKDVQEQGKDAVVSDVKEKVEVLKSKITGAASDATSEKDKKWEKNGYAHAPLWPQVSYAQLHGLSEPTLTI